VRRILLLCDRLFETYCLGISLGFLFLQIFAGLMSHFPLNLMDQFIDLLRATLLTALAPAQSFGKPTLLCSTKFTIDNNAVALNSATVTLLDSVVSVSISAESAEGIATGGAVGLSN
jgi:hypothetical protein